MDKSTLKQVAGSVFERYPEQDKVFITSDGQAFFDETHAKNHASPSKKRQKELTVEKFLREEKKAEGEKTAKELIAKIEAAGTVEEVTAIVKAETEGSARKSVLEAATKKIEKFKTT